MTELPFVTERSDGPKHWRFFQGPEARLCLYTLSIEAGSRHRVYTPQPGDEVGGDDQQPVALRTVTVIPPGGHVLIHSSGLSRTGEWLGTFERVGGGIVFNAEFDYEGVVDSEWICVAPVMGSGFWHGNDLQRLILEPGEFYEFNDKSVMAICMYGENRGKAFVAEPGERLVVAETTLLCAWEKRDAIPA